VANATEKEPALISEPSAAVNWRPALQQFIREQARPQEKFGHQPRLYALTLQIGAGLAYDDDVVYAAAYLHDLGVFVGHRPEEPDLLERWNHVAYTLERTPEILIGIGFPARKILAVQECIRNHQPQDTPETLESTILRDADILEQLGAIGVARTLCKIGRDTRFATFTAAAASLQKAAEALPALLRLPASQRLGESRLQLHRAFLGALQDEAGELLL
jgi:uncharacterized protein